MTALLFPLSFFCLVLIFLASHSLHLLPTPHLSLAKEAGRAWTQVKRGLGGQPRVQRGKGGIPQLVMGTGWVAIPGTDRTGAVLCWISNQATRNWLWLVNDEVLNKCTRESGADMAKGADERATTI